MTNARVLQNRHHYQQSDHNMYQTFHEENECIMSLQTCMLQKSM